MVTSAKHLLTLVELTSITYFEYSGRRTSSSAEVSEEGPANAKSQVMQLVREELMSIRCRVEVDTAKGEYIVDLAVNYSLPESVEIAEEAIDEFINRVAMMTLWPYIRIGIQELTARLEGRSLVLGLHVPQVGDQLVNDNGPDELHTNADSRGK